MALEEKGITCAWKEADITGKGNFSTMIRDLIGDCVNIFQMSPDE